MAENPPGSTRSGFFQRLIKRSRKSLATNPFELQRFAFFVVVPIGVWWMFSDNDRVDRMYRMVRTADFKILPLPPSITNL
jgi:hypothetical protein